MIHSVRAPKVAVSHWMARLRRRHDLRNRVLLVSDNAGWVLDQIADGLTAHLPSALRATMASPGDGVDARRCVIHFVNRLWAWQDGLLDRVHPSNRLVGLWTHGHLDSPQADIQASLDRIRRLHARFARLQVACSRARETMLAIGVSLEKIVFLPFGVDLRRFRPPDTPAERERVRARLGIPPRAIAAGCFQKDGEGWGDGMVPKWVKGPDVLADVLGGLAKHFPVHAVIPGPARGYLRHRLAAGGVPYSSPGFVPPEDLPAYYRALDVYISPSRDEAGPMGVLESMASGVPVIATRTGMAADLIEHGVNGFLADVEDVGRLVEGAASVIQAPEVHARIADRGLRTIQMYDWPHLARRYADELYRPAWRAPSPW